MFPAELIPAAPQTLWGRPAVANFVLGGAGAGLYVAAALFDRFVSLAAWLGPALVLAGFACVAGEAGRPLRGPRVLARIRTSWMSRELWFGGAFVVLAGSEPVLALPGQRAAAVLAAVGLSLAQGFMLRRARGVAAWDAPVMPVAFLVSALLSGTAVLALVDVAAGHRPTWTFLGSLLGLLLLGGLLWFAYLDWSSTEPLAGATRALREGPGAVAIVVAGYVVPFALLTASFAAPDAVRPLAALAALSMLAGQIHAKAALVLAAGRLRPIRLVLGRSRAAAHSGSPRPETGLRLRTPTSGHAVAEVRSRAAPLSGHPAGEVRSQAAPFSGHPRSEPASWHPLQRRSSS